MSTRRTGGGLVAVIGLARSGESVSALLRRRGREVYASDSGDGPRLREAAARLHAAGVEVQLGGHDLERIRGATLVVVSPGIPPSAPPLRAARDAGVPVLSEVAIALEELRDSRVIAVTGTNGKSTTTALAAHLLSALGQRAIAAGNIGRALSDVALDQDAPEWIALELSSFQLHDTLDLRPAVGILTNLSPDHLDRYQSVEEYYGDKRRLFDGAQPDSVWVTNADDREVRRMVEGIPGAHYRFSLEHAAEASYDRSSDELRLFGRRLCARRELQLIGGHNVANALAASLAVVVGLGGRHDEPQRLDRIGSALRAFRGLPHRLERVGEVDGILWINDSKATNVESARVALRAMDRPTVLLLGGRHKGDSYRPLLGTGAPLKYIIAYGEAAPIIEGELADASPAFERMGGDFAAVVQRARRIARAGDAVLLAPACSSYDLFRDYEERGERFRALALGGAA